jgi:hypothetical protein
MIDQDLKELYDLSRQIKNKSKRYRIVKQVKKNLYNKYGIDLKGAK